VFGTIFKESEIASIKKTNFGSKWTASTHVCSHSKSWFCYGFEQTVKYGDRSDIETGVGNSSEIALAVLKSIAFDRADVTVCKCVCVIKSFDPTGVQFAFCQLLTLRLISRTTFSERKGNEIKTQCGK
jgi:hypothetical protein